MKGISCLRSTNSSAACEFPAQFSLKSHLLRSNCRKALAACVGDWDNSIEFAWIGQVNDAIPWNRCRNTEGAEMEFRSFQLCHPVFRCCLHTSSFFSPGSMFFFLFFSPVMKRTGAYFGYLWLALEIIGICSNSMSKALPSISCRQLPHLEEVSRCTNMSWSCLAHQIVLRHTETIWDPSFRQLRWSTYSWS